MSIKTVDIEYQLGLTLDRMQETGLLLTSSDDEGVPNVMTIGWGNPGIVWGRPIFIVLVRPTRYTFQNIESTGEFVVNVPTDDMGDICQYCGSVSGRDESKFQESGMTPRAGHTVNVPRIEECIMHYECQVLQRNDLVESQLDAKVRDEFYGTGDFHRVYYGEVLEVTAQA